MFYYYFPCDSQLLFSVMLRHFHGCNYLGAQAPMLKPRSKTHVNHSIDVGQKCYVKNRSLLWMLAK